MPNTRGFVHELFLTNEKLYQISQVPQGTKKDSEEGEVRLHTPAQSLSDFLLQQREEILGALNNAPLDGSSTDPFLQKFCWQESLQGILPETAEYVVGPPDLSDPLAIIPRLTAAYYEEIIQIMKGGHFKYTTLLRWVKSTKE